MTTDGDKKITETPSRGDYRASVSSGLKRLESEKLSFLRPQSIVSKFNQSHIAQYSKPTEKTSDKTVPDAVFHQNISSQVVTTRFSRSQADTVVDTFETQQDILPNTLSKTGNIVADEVDNLKNDRRNSSTLNFAAIRAKSSAELKAVSASSLMPVQDEDEDFSQSRIFIPASVPKSSSSEKHTSAINKLRAQGLFDTLVNTSSQTNLKPVSTENIQSTNDTVIEITTDQTDDLTQNDFTQDDFTQVDTSEPSIQSGELIYPTGWKLITDGDEDDYTDVDIEDDLSPLLNDSFEIPQQDDNPEIHTQETEPTPNISKPHPIIQTAQQDNPVHEAEPPKPPSPRPGKARKIAVFFTVILVICVMAILAWVIVNHVNENQPQFKFDNLFNNIDDIVDSPSNVQEPDIPPVPEQEKDDASHIIIQGSIQQASDHVAESFNIDQWFDAQLQAKLSEEDCDVETKIELIKDAVMLFPENPDYAAGYADLLLSTGKIKEARSFITQLPTSLSSDPNIRVIYFQSFADDKHFIGPIHEINDNNCDEIAPLGGGSTLTFKFYRNGKISGAFKPLQTRRQSNYRAEIAAWRLCELLQCDFSIPYNRPVKIEYDTFYRLYNKSKSKKRETYRKELVDIIWTKEKNKSYVYGTLKDWVPDFTRFPIELTSMWMPWVSQKDFMRKYPTLKNAIYELSQRANTTRLYNAIIARAKELDTKQLASQISQVLTFDFLIGNWDRFSGVPEWWGVNCQFKDNQIVSIDNGASFPAYSNERVQERFLMTERFSTHFIHALRTLNKEQTLNLLFPNPSKYELESFEQFWSQRSAVLARIDSLSQIYGVDRVLSFE